MSLDSASAAGADVASRIAAIQQMASQLGMGGSATAATGFQTALDSASTASAATDVSATTTNTTATGMPYATEINAAAAKYGIDPSLLAGLVKQESGFNPNATSGAGAKGLTQLMPATAKALGVTNTSDPVQSLDGGAHYLKEQLDRFGGDVTKAVAAYNAGPGAVQRYGGVPPYAETQNYVKAVLANRDAYAKAATASGAVSVSPTGAAQTIASLTGASATAASSLSSVSNPMASSLAALSTDDTSTDSGNSSNLSIGSSSSSARSGTSSSLGYPTT